MGTVLLLLTGCAAEPLKPGAEKVHFMQSEPKGCKYLGEATGNQGNAFIGGLTSNENMETGARNTLKNKAGGRRRTASLLQKESCRARRVLP